MSHPPNTPLGRFGIVTSEEGPQRCVASIPAGGMVNFLRQFRIGPESRYEGAALRVGRSSGVAQARAVGDDGKAAVIARITAYLG